MRDGYACGRNATAECCDCEAKLCELHTEKCDLCLKFYCSMCFLFHMDEPHAKPIEAVKKHDAERRRA